MSGMEPILIGAAVGGASSAIQGGNPLEGALLGGVTGGVGSALSGAGAGALASATDAAAGEALPGLLANQGLSAVEPAAIDWAALGAPTASPAQFVGQVPLGADIGNLSSAIPQLPFTPPAAYTPSVDMAAVAPPVPGAQIAGAGNFPFAEDAAKSSSSFGDWASEQGGKAWDWAKKNPLPAATLGIGALSMLGPQPTVPGTTPYQSSFDRNKFKPSLPQNAVYTPRYAADGGIMNLSGSNDYENDGVYNSPVPMASGGISSLGGYSDGGRMLKGPGDGMSDSIPASIAGKRPARLADGEFVVPADVVSHLGNGSTDAGAKQLYAMMDKVRKARTGSKKQGKQINPNKYVPA